MKAQIYFDSKGNMPPDQFLHAVDLLLVDEAADWAETD